MIKRTSVFFILLISTGNYACKTKKAYHHLSVSDFQPSIKSIKSNDTEKERTLSACNKINDTIQFHALDQKISLRKTLNAGKTNLKPSPLLLEKDFSPMVKSEDIYIHHNDIVPEKKANTRTLLLIAFLFPPMAIALKKGLKSWQFFLTLGLTFCLFVPGMVYAVWVIFRNRHN